MADQKPVFNNYDALISDFLEIRKGANELPGNSRKDGIMQLSSYSTGAAYRSMIEAMIHGTQNLGPYNASRKKYDALSVTGRADVGWGASVYNWLPGNDYVSTDHTVSQHFVDLMKKLGLDRANSEKWDLFASGLNSVLKDGQEIRQNHGKLHEALMAGFKAVAGDGNDLAGEEALNRFLADTYGRSKKTSLEDGIAPGSALDTVIKEHRALPQNLPENQKNKDAPAGVINPDGTITTVTPDGKSAILKKDQNGKFVELPKTDPLYQTQGTIAPRVFIPDGP